MTDLRGNTVGTKLTDEELQALDAKLAEYGMGTRSSLIRKFVRLCLGIDPLPGEQPATETKPKPKRPKA